jgi:hypothetical protein
MVDPTDRRRSRVFPQGLRDRETPAGIGSGNVLWTAQVSFGIGIDLSELGPIEMHGGVSKTQVHRLL